MFEESVAGRDEMASCLLKCIDSITLPPVFKKLIILSDSCPSQNRNFGCYFTILGKISTNWNNRTQVFGKRPCASRRRFCSFNDWKRMEETNANQNYGALGLATVSENL